MSPPAVEQESLNRVTIPAIRAQPEQEGRVVDDVMGEDTENELSLSRQDDSDMSEEESIIDQPEELEQRQLQVMPALEEAKHEAEQESV